jgi:hypothetical protein
LDLWQEDPEGTESPSSLAEGPNNHPQLDQQNVIKGNSIEESYDIHFSQESKHANMKTFFVTTNL